MYKVCARKSHAVESTLSKLITQFTGHWFWKAEGVLEITLYKARSGFVGLFLKARTTSQEFIESVTNTKLILHPAEENKSHYKMSGPE